MEADPKPPFAVAFCRAMIGVAARIVPAVQRQDWQDEWLAEIWHHWQFLFYAGMWNRREALRLIRNCLGSFADAAWHFVSQESVVMRLRGCARSPWTCLGGWAVLLLIVAALSAGLPATRQMLTYRSQSNSRQLVFIWRHPVIGGRDTGLPPDVVPAWGIHSRLLESVAPFHINGALAASANGKIARPMVVRTQANLFHVLQMRPALGTFQPGVVLDHRTWISLFHGNPNAIGSKMRIGADIVRVAAVLPASFQFLTRQPSIYLVVHEMFDPRVMVVARARGGTSKDALDRELTKIAEDYCYYFYASQLRFEFLDSTFLTPLGSFGFSVLASALLVLAMCRVRWRHVRLAWRRGNRSATARRTLFFFAKTAIALAFVFVAGLEWSRPESSILFASNDAGNGPFLVWLYILGTMGVLFWSVADQRARCRVCLRLLCFPVRVGCPGCLLLDWSGTELLCTEGHGMLHVPDLAPSWDEEAEHWIALDESWRGLFVDTK